MIEVGEYIRTTDGEIEKVVLIYDNRYMNEDGNMTHFDDIKAHSKNIIDLIEADDYVNGDEVIIVYGYDKEGNDKDGLGICLVDDDYAYYKFLEEIDIKTIVTREQFNSVMYKVGDIE